MTSRPVYTSTADGYRDAKEIAALRPMAAAKPRAPRKPAARVSVSTGIVCFCGERFAESQALEFMKHLRAEVGAELRVAGNRRKWAREYVNRRRRRDPEYAAAEAERLRKWRQRPEVTEHQREYDRDRRADPVVRARRAEQERERRARKKAEREAQVN